MVSPLRYTLDVWLITVLSRLRTRKALLVLVTFSGALLFLYTSVLGNETGFAGWTGTFNWLGSSEESACSAKEYASGHWVRKPYYTRSGPLGTTPVPTVISQESVGPTNMTRPEDILTFARFEGCASSREFWWHLAADRKEQWDRFPGALEWEWVPGGRCASSAAGLREWKVEEVVRDLVEGGGWLLIGDSVTENHFFSLSCLLYPHVTSAPDYTSSSSFDRAWPQHLYLNPDSPLLQHDGTILITKHRAGQNARRKLRLPPGFNISTTPLVTFRRVDLLFSQEELKTMHQDLYPEFYQANASFQLFGDETVWTMSADDYLDVFTKPLPEGHYTTLVTSTAGHWTTSLFAGYQNDGGGGASPVYGYDGLIQFFGEAMEQWAEKVQKRIDQANGGSRAAYPPGRKGVSLAQGVERPKQAVVRAYLPGHEDCHAHREAWQEIVPFKWNWYNWGVIWKYNQVYERLLAPSKETKVFKNVHYLPIDIPGRLRPDAHASGDCLHIMTGAGVLEGWSHYIWHFITREV